MASAKMCMDTGFNIVYTNHAHIKFRILKDHGFEVTQKQVEITVLEPDPGRIGRYEN